MSDTKKLTIRFVLRKSGFLWMKRIIVVQKEVSEEEFFKGDSVCLTFNAILGNSGKRYWVDAQAEDFMQNCIQSLVPENCNE